MVNLYTVEYEERRGSTIGMQWFPVVETFHWDHFGGAAESAGDLVERLKKRQEQGDIRNLSWCKWEPTDGSPLMTSQVVTLAPEMTRHRGPLNLGPLNIRCESRLIH